MRHLFCMVFLAVAAQAQAQVDVPALTRRVTDLTGTLSNTQITGLESKISAFETKKGSQIAVLIVPTTQPEDIAQFGIRVADAWKIGRKQYDDGAILIIAKADRRLRIEVGYGLEGVIPDAIAKRIIEDIIKPYFKQGDFASGIDAGVSQLMRMIEGEAMPVPQARGGGGNDNSFVLIVFGGVLLGYILSAMFGRPVSALLSGVGSVGAALLLLGLPVLMAVFVGLMVFFLVAVRPAARHSWSTGGFGNGGPWRGGGGGFGGGGASGSW